jgi:hypothetical protein
MDETCRYTSKLLGYSIDYPASWVIRSPQRDDVDFHLCDESSCFENNLPSVAIVAVEGRFDWTKSLRMMEFLVRKDKDADPNAEFGEPDVIMQDDLAGAVVSYAERTINGRRRMGIDKVFVHRGKAMIVSASMDPDDEIEHLKTANAITRSMKWIGSQLTQ